MLLFCRNMREYKKILAHIYSYLGFPGSSMVKNLPANARDVGLIPGSGRSRGEGNGNPVFLHGKPRGQKELAPHCSLCGHKESDVT